ncbi:MAG: hypothetical protein ISS00_00095 [Candidatus Marinimicrobia bacterium]|nr:hypothetical protein [Candidatus Neomarinimicrobiota bacterium]
MKNKNLMIVIGAVALIILGYFALREDAEKKPTEHNHSAMGGGEHAGMSEMAAKAPDFDILKENEIVPFNTMQKLDDEWSFKIVQFVPAGTVSTSGDGVLGSVSDAETNPAIKADFYQNGELKHYQISFQEMPGMHSLKAGQVYFVEMHGYEGFKKSGDEFLVEALSLTIGKVK